MYLIKAAVWSQIFHRNQFTCAADGIADQNLLVPVTGTHDLALWNTDKITGYDFYTDASYVDIASVHVK